MLSWQIAWYVTGCCICRHQFAWRAPGACSFEQPGDSTELPVQALQHTTYTMLLASHLLHLLQPRMFSCSLPTHAGNGHGTHCGGIIAAKNQGQGIFGVVPGMPLLAFKVLSREGSGALENVYNAYKEIIARLQKGEKIVAINLSLSSQSDDEETKAYECGLVTKIQAFGTAVAAAAGNDGEALDYNLPAACMQTMTVTSLDVNDNPSYFSNYATAGSTKAATLIAGPGHSIYSTYTGGGYQTLSGTSM